MSRRIRTTGQAGAARAAAHEVLAARASFIPNLQPPESDTKERSRPVRVRDLAREFRDSTEAALFGTFAATVLFVLMAGNALRFALDGASAVQLTAGFVGVAVVAAVTALAPLLGVLLVTLHGKDNMMLEEYGNTYRTILFTSFVVLSVTGLLCGITAVFAENMFSTWVLAFAVPTVSATITVTAFALNSALEWHGVETKRNPYAR
jgi:hypothetical protein